jgi:hypothetical protein
VALKNVQVPLVAEITHALPQLIVEALPLKEVQRQKEAERMAWGNASQAAQKMTALSGAVIATSLGLRHLQQQLQRGQEGIWMQLINTAQLTVALEDVVSTLPATTTTTVNQLLETLAQYRLTKIKKHHCNKDAVDTEGCIINIVSILPIFESKKHMQLWQPRAIPTGHRDAITNHIQWSVMEIDELPIVRQGKEHRAVGEMDLSNCAKALVKQTFDICMRNIISWKPISRCIMQALKSDKKALTTCRRKAITPPLEQLRELDDDEWTFVDPTPGQITEYCPVANTTIEAELPPSGILRVKPGCTYKTKDTPFSHLLPAIRDVVWEVVPGLHPPPKPARDLMEEIDAIQLHFRQHGHFYMIAITGVMTVIMTSLCGLIVCRCRQYHRRHRRRQQRQRQRLQQEGLMDQENEGSPIFRPTTRSATAFDLSLIGASDLLGIRRPL